MEVSRVANTDLEFIREVCVVKGPQGLLDRRWWEGQRRACRVKSSRLGVSTGGATGIGQTGRRTPRKEVQARSNEERLSWRNKHLPVQMPEIRLGWKRVHWIGPGRLSDHKKKHSAVRPTLFKKLMEKERSQGSKQWEIMQKIEPIITRWHNQMALGSLIRGNGKKYRKQVDYLGK